MKNNASSRGMTRRQFVKDTVNYSAAFGAIPAAAPSRRGPFSGTEPAMELYRGVYEIRSLFGDRNLFQYLFAGGRNVLLDTGIADTPRKAIFPSLSRLGIRPEQITLALTTHADGDHQGGNFTIRQASPRTLLACGKADQAMVEDPRTLWDLRYNFLDADYGVGISPEPSPDAGRPCKMDLCFTGGERVRLQSDWELEVLHVPGHSHGSLGFYDRNNRAAFVGDAIHGRGCPKAGGGMALPPTYYYVDAYLSTLTYIGNLPIHVLYTGHWPTMRGDEIHDFIAESRQTVETFDRVILEALDAHPGLTMNELIVAVGEAFDIWPKDTWIFLMFAIKGHMDRLEQQRKVRTLRETRPFRWTRT